jgi:hypothetical protein
LFLRFLIMGNFSSESLSTVVAVDEVPEKFDAEKLGRKRPEVFSSTFVEVVFVGSMLMCLSMAV